MAIPTGMEIMAIVFNIYAWLSPLGVGDAGGNSLILSFFNALFYPFFLAANVSAAGGKKHERMRPRRG
jgi:hypothetical protein